MSATSLCPEHGVAWKFVQPGVSKKTGQPYTGFYCCPVKGCEQRPGREAGVAAAPTPPASRSTPAAPKPAAPNWDKIAAGKCRSLAICAWLQSGKPIEEFWEHADTIQAYMMEGRTPFNAATDMPDWDPADPGPDIPF